MWQISVTEKCEKIPPKNANVFLEFGPLEIGLKYEIAEDIHTNCVIHVEKLVVFLKDLYMKFIADTKPYFIEVFFLVFNASLTLGKSIF